MLDGEPTDNERERQDKCDVEKPRLMIKPGYNGRECDHDQGSSETEGDINPEEKGNLFMSNM